MVCVLPALLLVVYNILDANWGSSEEARQYQTTLASILKISRRAENVKLYNPQVLVMAGRPFERPGLIDMAHVITRMGSFMIVADIEKVKNIIFRKSDNLIRSSDTVSKNRS